MDTTILIVIVLIILCCCSSIVGGGGYYYYTMTKETINKKDTAPSSTAPSSTAPSSTTPSSTTPSTTKTYIPSAKYISVENYDVTGNDIACYDDGSSADFCQKKCDNDTTCKSYNYVSKGSVWGDKSGCCYKKSNKPFVKTTGVNFYYIPDPLSPELSAGFEAYAKMVSGK